jgi:hypothetical protein
MKISNTQKYIIEFVLFVIGTVLLGFATHWTGNIISYSDTLTIVALVTIFSPFAIEIGGTVLGVFKK